MKKLSPAVIVLAVGVLLILLSLIFGGFWSVLVLILSIPFLALGALRTVNFIRYAQKQRQSKRRRSTTYRSRYWKTTWLCFGIGGILLLAAIIGFAKKDKAPETPKEQPTAVATTNDDSLPHSVEATDPDAQSILWEIIQNEQVVNDYNRAEPIRFGDPASYFSLPGIATFRGNNYRDNPAYGTAVVNEETLDLTWTSATSTLPNSSWSGSGWTGQPLIVEWDKDTKLIMNMYNDKKQKDGLVEVIYATLDGHIYFLDIDDGSYTRDPLDIGMCFKGAGSLDPRGYPLMYVGAGDVNGNGERPRMYIISLIDGSILFERGHDEDLAFRRDNSSWCAFDSSPLVDAETDTLIWPGENGLLYTIKLNTAYDKTAGTLSIAPDAPVMTRYNTQRSGRESYWYGYEASADIVGEHLYVSENGGMFYCINLNTMELVWAQDTKDDSNGSPVFEKISDTECYIYTAPSLHWTKDGNSEGTISIFKLNALTGEIVWETPYEVHTVEGVSGGVQSTALLGKKGTEFEGLIFFTIARTPDVDTGYLVALDTETGKEVWRMAMDHYAWSSPVAVYEEDGNGYLVVCDSAGYAFLIDGFTGDEIDRISLGGLVEATPAVYNNKIIVGTKTKQICGITIH